jgi:signal transduction histidine kinase
LTEFTRVATASRVFALAAILGLTVVFSSPAALQAVFVVSVVAAIAIYLSASTALAGQWILASEAGVASLIVVLALPESSFLLPYLVALALLAGLNRGFSGAGLVTAFQLIAILTLAVTSQGLSGISQHSQFLAPWILTIAGAGLLGAWVKSIGKAPTGSSTDQSYDAARRLLGQLRNLARRLPTGLDPIGIASRVLVTVEERTDYGQSAVFARTEGGIFAPLAYRGHNARETLDPENPLIAECWKKASARTGSVAEKASRGQHLLALPLRLGSETVGVVYAQGDVEVSQTALVALQPELDELSLRLATALAFDEVRSMATSDERQRLAREIHGGGAQEVASLGYVLDELAATTSDPKAAAGIKDLREDLSRVVTELRLSIFDLRTDVGDGPGIGTALSEYVRRVGARSSMTVHLTLDEAPTRLSPAVETELFRITQEAITNARKHSEAENLWVDCWVRPPSARIRVRDDGRGLGAGRADSYGLGIMRERAERIDAQVQVDQHRLAPDRPGTCVTISIGAEGSDNTHTAIVLKGTGAA